MSCPLPIAFFAFALVAAATGDARALPAEATVRGEIRRPGAYSLAPGETLSSLIERAGGFTDNAFLPGAALSRRAEKRRQGEELEAVVREIRTRLSGGRAGGDIEAKDAFLAALAGLCASGRVPVRLSHPRLLRGSPADVLLEDGDVLFVPGPPATVAVAGAVASPGRYPHIPGASLRKYVRRAGGGTAEADLPRAWILRADGSAAPLSRRVVAWNPTRSRWELIGFQTGIDRRIGPGDTLVVPKDPAQVPWLPEGGDVGDLLIRAAVLAGAVVAP